MKANEFIRWHGLLESKKHLEWMVRAEARQDIHGWFMDDLKRLIESHELVESCGGLQSVKDTFNFAWSHGADELTEYGERLKQAIADVESCQ